jgi:hypothetical protein
MRAYVLSVLCVLCVPFSHALTDSWTADIRQNASQERVYKRGESWDLRVALKDGNSALDLGTGATAALYWYTNSTDNLWWSNEASVVSSSPAVVAARWTPDMDTGPSVNWFWIGVRLGGTQLLWRVSGTVRLLGSPGSSPNSLPLPQRSIDFSTVTVTNAPWATTNALADALQAAAPTNYLRAAEYAPGRYRLYLVTP